MVNECGIPQDRIFHSRSVGFLRDVKKATGGRGVDVVLNSLSGELLHASWECVAPFGCMVEIGKRDLIGHGALALEPFEQNRGYFGVEFARLSAERPEIPFRYVISILASPIHVIPAGLYATTVTLTGWLADPYDNTES